MILLLSLDEDSTGDNTTSKFLDTHECYTFMSGFEECFNCDIEEETHENSSCEPNGDVNIAPGHSDSANSESQASGLFDNCQLARQQSHLLITKYAARHSLSKVALQDLLSLIRLHCPPTNNCYHTLYKFHKDSSSVENTINLVYYCANCTQEVCDLSKDICCSCKNDLKAKGSLSSFMEISIENQLKGLFSSKLNSII